MKRPSLFFQFCLILAAQFFYSAVQAQQVFKTTKESVIGYLEYLPQGYSSNSNKYPLVIFLHGKGEKGPDGKNASTLKGGVDKLTKLGPPQHVKKGTKFPFILISPQLKKSYSDWTSEYVLEVLDHVKKYLRIDYDRIYITGLSLGGGASWVIAQKNPDLFAAVAPVCGSWNDPKRACEFAEHGTSVWAFHGDKDSTIPLSRTLNMVNAINNCSPRPNPKAKVTIYPGMKHDIWGKAYAPDHSVHSPNIYEWMLQHKRSGGNTNKPAPTSAPDIDAGPDQELTLPASSLKIVASVDGDYKSYGWTQIGGNKASLSGSSSRTATISSLKEGVYKFRFTIRYKESDGDDKEKHDDVTVTVKRSGNHAPVVSAGGDKSLTLPDNHVVLQGKATDEDKDKLTWYWKQQQGAGVTMKSAKTPNLDVSGLKAGTYRFRLTVKDNRGGEAYDEVNIVVKAASGNHAPVANAGSDKHLTLPDSHVILQGKGTDSDKDELTYYWKQQEGAGVTMKGAHSPTLDVSRLKEGTYRFRLTVKDKHGAQHYDEATITVKAPSNHAPVASAGSDKKVTLPDDRVMLYGAGTDRDGDKLTYYWKQQEGAGVIMKGAHTSRLDVDGLKEGTYRFRLTVKDSHGSSHYDDAWITVRKK